MTKISENKTVNEHEEYLALLKKNEDLKKVFDSIINVESNDVTKENANVSSETINGQVFKMWSETSKQYANDYILSPETKKYKDMPKDVTHFLIHQ